MHDSFSFVLLKNTFFSRLLLCYSRVVSYRSIVNHNVFSVDIQYSHCTRRASICNFILLVCIFSASSKNVQAKLFLWKHEIVKKMEKMKNTCLRS